MHVGDVPEWTESSVHFSIDVSALFAPMVLRAHRTRRITLRKYMSVFEVTALNLGFNFRSNWTIANVDLGLGRLYCFILERAELFPWGYVCVFVQFYCFCLNYFTFTTESKANIDEKRLSLHYITTVYCYDWSRSWLTWTKSMLCFSLHVNLIFACLWV